MIWELLEALAIVAVVLGGFLLFGPWALVVCGSVFIAVSVIRGHLARKGGSA